MREIKFRGKDRRTGEWFFGNLYDKDNRGRTHICTTLKGSLDVIPETVGQYTGLKDCNGKEIYENDIVMLNSTIKSEVVWHGKLGAFALLEPYSQIVGERPLGGMLEYFPNLEVIGNMYDNVELLVQCE